MSQAGQYTQEILHEIKTKPHTIDELKNILNTVNEQLQKYEDIRRLLKQNESKPFTYDLFCRAMNIASQGAGIPISEEQWNLMLPSHVEEQRNNLMSVISEGEKGFNEIQYEVKKELDQMSASAGLDKPMASGCVAVFVLFAVLQLIVWWALKHLGLGTRIFLSIVALFISFGIMEKMLGDED